MVIAEEGRHLAKQEAQIEREKGALANVRAISTNERVAAAEERIARAVDDYKASLAFEMEVSEGCVEAYRLRFGDCKVVILACRY